MTQGSVCMWTMEGFLLVISVVFIVVAVMSMRRVKELRKKIAELNASAGQKDKELEEARAASKSVFSPFMTNAKSIIISVDSAGKILSINDYGEELFGYEKGQLLGKNVVGTILPIPDKKDSLEANVITRVFSNPKLYVEYETECVKKDGERLWVSWTNRFIYNGKGKPIEVKSVGFDISKRKKLEEELRYLSSIDPLTGVLNRQALLQVGATEVKRATRYNRQISVMAMKLDYYKTVTGTEQVFSDDILQETVAICRRAMRDSDAIGRIGDVEFAIILPETPAENGIFLAERLKSRIQERNLKSESGSFVTASFGVAGREGKEDTIDSLLLRATESLNKSKSTKKNKRTTKEKE